MNPGLLALNDTILLVLTAIEAVELALNRNPSPDVRIKLMERLTDLRTLRDQLQARQTQILNSGQIIPAPPAGLLATVQTQTAAVEAAKNAGTAANAVVDVARAAFAAAAAIKPHFG